MRLAIVVTVLCLGTPGLVTSTDVTRRVTRIAPQELAQALQTLVKDREVQLVYRSELVGDRLTPGVDGVFTLDEALTRLLLGSGLQYRYLDDRAITLVQEK